VTTFRKRRFPSAEIEAMVARALLDATVIEMARILAPTPLHEIAGFLNAVEKRTIEGLPDIVRANPDSPVSRIMLASIKKLFAEMREDTGLTKSAASH
jgi:hypothetical protein